MILNDTYKLAFVHIPKCAGTTLRSRIGFLEERNDFYMNVNVHPEAGPLDYGHLPLGVLRDFFNEDFEKISSYWSFAIVRDPYKRFPSSVGQYLRQHSTTPLYSLTIEKIEAEVVKLIKLLESGATHTDAQMALFLPQVDFINLGGKQIVSDVFHVGELDQVIDMVSKRIGKELPAFEKGERQNQSYVYKNSGIRILMNLVRPIVGEVVGNLPETWRHSLRKALYGDAEKALEAVFQLQPVKDFVTQFYALDIALYQKVVERRSENR